ncbi:MAG: NADPH:quinone reductase [Pyrinomonadaceae bacterium]
MKAITVEEFGGPEVMKLAEVPQRVPAGFQVLVQVIAAGVNPVDTYLRSGNHVHAPELPYTPGKDGAGVVAAVGPDVSKFKVADRVYTADSITGTYAEFSLCEESQLALLPDNTSFEAGAGVWTPYATSLRALFEKAQVKAGETVLIHGASGGVGIAAVQWAKHAGLKIVGTAGSDEGKQLVSELGADLVVDHLSSDKDAAANSKDKILEFTGGRGVDVVVEMLANVNLLLDFDVLAMFGRICVVGNRGSLEFNPRAAMTKDATIYGLSLFNAPRSVRDSIHEAIYKGLRDGYLRPVVSRKFELREAPKAHREVIESRALGKIVLIP